MTESPPNTLCHTVYADPTIGLTVTAWPNPKPERGGWLVCFLRRNTQRKLLDQIAGWHLCGGWDPARWRPALARPVPPAVLAAVEAWLRDQAAVEAWLQSQAAEVVK